MRAMVSGYETKLHLTVLLSWHGWAMVSELIYSSFSLASIRPGVCVRKEGGEGLERSEFSCPHYIIWTLSVQSPFSLPGFF